MTKWMLLVAVMPLLFSCASMPAPEGPDDSLVIGYFALDFPEGFFEQSKRTFTSGVTLNIKNETTGGRFRLTTSKGYFQFLSNGSDSYLIEEYSFQERDQSGRYGVKGEVNRKFSTRTHSVVYLGHLTVVYTKPKATHKTSADLKSNYWAFKTSDDFKYNEGELLSYLRDKDPECPWLEYEVVH